MTTPLFETYDQKDVLISPQDQISNFHRNHNAKITKLPSTCILAAMNPNRIERNLQGWKLKRQMQFIPGSPDFPLKIYQKGNKEMLVAYGGMGGAALCNTLELVIALGVKKVYMIGMCGGITNARIGDIVVAEKAIRDEGISYHYLERSKEAKASVSVKLPAKYGAVWTTDAMYRETLTKYHKYKKHGLLCVDMEAASAYAVAEFRRIKIVSLLVVSDIVEPEKWNPQFHNDKVEDGIKRILKGLSI